MERHFENSNLKLLQQYIEVMHPIVDVNKEMGLSVVMLHYPTFPDFKDLNVFALVSVPLPKDLQSKHN